MSWASPRPGSPEAAQFRLPHVAQHARKRSFRDCWRFPSSLGCRGPREPRDRPPPGDCRGERLARLLANMEEMGQFAPPGPSRPSTPTARRALRPSAPDTLPHRKLRPLRQIASTATTSPPRSCTTASFWATCIDSTAGLSTGSPCTMAPSRRRRRPRRSSRGQSID
jgi:hypothetical protein